MISQCKKFTVLFYLLKVVSVCYLCPAAMIFFQLKNPRTVKQICRSVHLAYEKLSQVEGTMYE